ncbi:NUDIX domain protein [compost metagenome]
MSRLKKLSQIDNFNVVYSDQKLPTEVLKTIFLAGPTPRDNSVTSWRNEAVEIFKKNNFKGTLLIPEPSTGKFEHDYTDQVDWELEAMQMADVILFWIPRELDSMPAFTTNVEFGFWVNSGKIVFGFPKEAEKMRYLEYLAIDNDININDNLESTIKESIEKFGDGVVRTRGECKVPLFIWNLSSFQDWFKAQKSAGNRLDDAKLLWNFRMPNNKDIVFLWVLHANVYVASENRNKTNEFVISRTSTSSIVMYKKEEELLNSKVILVKEFRTPASTKDGFIWENPGGSSLKDNEDKLDVAQHEIEEEVGFNVDKDRIKYVQQRQSSGTILANKVSLFSVELTDEEIKWFEDQKGKTHGVTEDTEITYTEVKTLHEILDEELVDWSNIGMILKAIII